MGNGVTKDRAEVPVFLTPAVYDRAVAKGINLKGYARIKRIPVSSSPSIWVRRNGR